MDPPINPLVFGISELLQELESFVAEGAAAAGSRIVTPPENHGNGNGTIPPPATPAPVTNPIESSIIAKNKFEELPNEIQLHIMKFINDGNSLKSARLVSKSWNTNFMNKVFSTKMMTVFDTAKTSIVRNFKLGFQFLMGSRTIPTTSFRFINSPMQTLFLWVTPSTFSNVSILELQNCPLYVHQFYLIFATIPHISSLTLLDKTSIFDYKVQEIRGYPCVTENARTSYENMKNLKQLTIKLVDEETSESALSFFSSMKQLQLESLTVKLVKPNAVPAGNDAEVPGHRNDFLANHFEHGIHKCYLKFGTLMVNNSKSLKEVNMDFDNNDKRFSPILDILTRVIEKQNWLGQKWNKLTKLICNLGVVSTTLVPRTNAILRPSFESFTNLRELQLGHLITPAYEEEELSQLLPKTDGLAIIINGTQSIGTGEATPNLEDNPVNPLGANLAASILVAQDRSRVEQEQNAKSCLDLKFVKINNSNNYNKTVQTVEWRFNGVKWNDNSNSLQNSIVGRNLANITNLIITQSQLQLPLKIIVTNDMLQQILAEAKNLIKLELNACNLQSITDFGLTGISEEACARIRVENNFSNLAEGDQTGLAVSSLKCLQSLYLRNETSLEELGQLEGITDITANFGFRELHCQMKELSLIRTNISEAGKAILQSKFAHNQRVKLQV